MTDKDQQIEMSMSFYASWKDPRIFRKNNFTEKVNLKIDKEKIFLPDFYVYSLGELKTTKMFLGLSEALFLDPENNLK